MFDLDQLTAIQRPTIRKKPWMESKNFVLVTAETMPKVVDECIKSGYYALDLETTGLDNRSYNNATIDHMVGACISPDGETGYYLPLLHTDYMEKCIPNSVFKREMRRLTSSSAVAIFHNGKFDHEFLQFNGSDPFGEWEDPKKWEDTLILAYIRNTREKRKGLKHLSHTLLDMEMIELNELFSDEKADLDFSTLDPSWPPTLWYAASDAICTFLLYHRLRDEATKPTIDLPSQEPIYVIEKLGVTATRWMERNQIPIDRDKVVDLIRLGQQEWLPAMGVVFTEVSKALGRDVTPGYYRLLVGEDERFRFNPDDVELGITDNVNRAVAEAERKRMDPSDLDSKGKIRIHTIQKSMPSLVDKKQVETVEFPLVYDIRNPNQFGMMLRELGVPGLRVTEKSGQIQTTADEIDRVLEEAGDIFPYLAKVRRFREVARAITNNLMPLYKYTAKEFSPNGRIRINFEGHKVDTARFSTPKSTERKGWTGRIPWNIHSVPSGKKKDIPECLKRIRECIKAEDGFIIVACDFSGQELRVVTNLSRESMWENEFFRCSGCGHTFDRGGQVVPPTPEAPPPYCPECGSDSIGDIHTLTAQAIYGADVTESSDFKEKRGNSKCVHPDTLLRTPNGLIRIGSLPRGAEDTFKPITGLQVSSSQAMIPVKEVYNGGLKKLYHVVTRRGVLTCSAEHQFMLANGELKTISDGLNKGDVLVEIPTYVDTDREYPRIPHSPVPGMPTMDIQTSPEMAYFAGLHAGDGSSSPACAHIVHGSVDKTDLLGVPYKDWQKIIADSVSAVGITPVLKNKSVYLGSRVFLRWMEAIGLLTGSKRNFRIPNWIFQAGREAILHYLGGLIDTDGSATIGGDLSITTKDYVFAGQIAEAFRAVGCVASVGLSFNTTYQRWYLKIAIKRCEGKILAPYMKHPGKIARISNTTSRLNAWSNEVLLILESTEQPCVDLHVDSEDHLYLANGLLTHNSVNFALCYGGGGMAVVRAAGVSKDEGWRIKRQFDKTYTVLAGWWSRQHEFARRTKHVLTAFNRRYPLPDIDSADGGFRAKAERNAVNGPIQSTGADIMKYSMGLIYRECKKRGWLDLCKIIITMHDEIVFEIAESIFVEALEMIKYIMLKKCIERLPWRVPLTCDIEAGIDWTVPWNVTKIQHGKQKMPDALKHVLAPVTKETKESTEHSVSVVSSDGGQMAGVANPLPNLGKGEDFVYTIRNADLTMRTMNKLAEVIHRCRGRGEHTLRVRTEEGHDLWEGEPVKVNAGEFSVLINMPRL